MGKIDWELKRFHDNELSTHFRAYGWSGEGIKIINEELKDAGFAAAGWQRYPERVVEICAAICFRDRQEWEPHFKYAAPIFYSMSTRIF